MKFTTSGYLEVINMLKEGYDFCSYDEENLAKKVIIRHDIDFDLKSAYDFAMLELKNNVKANYFIMVTSEFYNIFSKENRDYILGIQNSGHSIGLHFDTQNYNISNNVDLIKQINNEREILEKITKKSVKFVSFHRPLENDFDITSDEFVNVYGKKYFQDMKYISDSRMHWREDLEENIKCGHNTLHILTHPIWYKENEIEMKKILIDYLIMKNVSTFKNLDNNFRNLNEVIKIKVKKDGVEYKW